ncbi:MAG: CPBP family intramembrane metalloprotease [Bacteroidaceae bacterium]|nr:CPBP family intramembrane metalloprotease [Bacteroidaceae bacterium]
MSTFRTHLRQHPFWVYILLFLFCQLASVPVGLLMARWLGYDQMLVGTLLFANVLAIILFLLYRPATVTWQSTLGGVRGRGGRRSALVFLLALPTILLVNLGQEAFFPDIPDLVGEETLQALMYHPLGLLTIAVLGPLSEELLFRGGVQSDLYRHTAQQGTWVAIALSAAIFALIHMNPAQMPAAFLLGILLGFAYWWTGSLVASVCIHVFNNSFACVLSFLSPDDDSLINFLGGSTSAGLTALICLFALLLTLRAVRKEGLKSTEEG